MTSEDKAHREIRKIAYALWMEQGQPDGRDREHWEAAKAIWAFRNNEAEPTLAAENQSPTPELTDQAEETSAPSLRKARKLATQNPNIHPSSGRH